MAGTRRMPWVPKKFWSPGEYTLLTDSYTAKDRVTYYKGETLALDQWEATRLGNLGIIAAPAGMHAVRARVEGGRATLRDEYLCEMWELTGAWEERGRS